MRDRCVVDLSTLGGAECSELIRIKVGAIIHDNTMRDSISECQLSDETDGSAGIETLDGFGFDPFSEHVDCYK